MKIIAILCAAWALWNGYAFMEARKLPDAGLLYGVDAEAQSPRANISASCEPLPDVKPRPGLAPNSSYATFPATEPPLRFQGPPKRPLTFYFGRANVDRICGPAPCGHTIRGCVRGRKIVLRNPFHTSDAETGRFLRHELAHINGWPETHGD